MHLKIPGSLITYAVLLFYLCTPMLDSMVCADCVGHVPFQGETTIAHMKTLHTDVSYSAKNEPQSDTDTEKGDPSFCSICANVLMNAEVSSFDPPIIVGLCSKPRAWPLISELHCFIDKPPQNSLV